MGLFSLEHGKAAYIADFAAHGAAVATLGGTLLATGATTSWRDGLTLVAAGLVAWTLLEYLLHRFVLHGLPPFSRWHAQHHRRPVALICAPTVLSMALLAAFACLAALAMGGIWQAGALTLGVAAGYLAYALTHHATHHWRGGGVWLLRRKRWHARHHHQPEPAAFGVTTAFWDHCFGTAGHGPRAARRPVPASAGTPP